MRDLARQHTTRAVQTLVAIMQSRRAPARARVAAAEVILDRGWGRPVPAEEQRESQAEAVTAIQIVLQVAGRPVDVDAPTVELPRPAPRYLRAQPRAAAGGREGP